MKTILKTLSLKPDIDYDSPGHLARKLGAALTEVTHYIPRVVHPIILVGSYFETAFKESYSKDKANLKVEYFPEDFRPGLIMKLNESEVWNASCNHSLNRYRKFFVSNYEILISDGESENTKPSASMLYTLNSLSNWSHYV